MEFKQGLEIGDWRWFEARDFLFEILEIWKDMDFVCKEVQELSLGAFYTMLVLIENLSYPDLTYTKPRKKTNQENMH